MKVNRRGFLAALLSAPVIPLVAKLPLEFDRKRAIFLPPRGGWVSSRPERLYLENLSYSVQHDVAYLYGQKQFPLAVARGRARITLAGNILASQAMDLDMMKPVEVAGFDGLWLPERADVTLRDAGNSEARVTLWQCWQREMS
jgi:hypothetical protein